VHHSLCCNKGTFGTSDLYALARAARIYLFHDSGIILHVTGVENFPVHSKIPAAEFLEGPNSPPPSSFTIPTIAAACAWRAVFGVIAIRAYLGGDDPERKGSRQLQRGFKGASGTLSRVPSIRRHGLRTCALYNAARNPRRLLCTRGRKRGWATRASLPLPRASACGIPASMLLSVLDHDKA
jgi:hypothetical protein